MGSMARRAVSSLVAGLTALMSGCAGMIPDQDAVAPSGVAHSDGFEVRRGRPGLVIGAPDAGADQRISREVARLTGFGLVAGGDPRGSGVEVRRVAVASAVAPGIDGASASPAYARRVAEASQGPLRLYVELRRRAAVAGGRGVDIRTVGLSSDDAWRVKTLLELIRDSRRGGADGAPALVVSV